MDLVYVLVNFCIYETDQLKDNITLLITFLHSTFPNDF